MALPVVLCRGGGEGALIKKNRKQNRKQGQTHKLEFYLFILKKKKLEKYGNIFLKVQNSKLKTQEKEGGDG